MKQELVHSPAMQQSHWKDASIGYGTRTFRVQCGEQMNSNCNTGSQDPYGIQADGTNLQLPDVRQNQMNFSAQNAPTGQGIPDLSALMFPSEDPFAYPNQPMITLENNNFVKHESPMGQNILMDSAPTICSPYGGFNPAPYSGTRQYTTDGEQNNIGMQHPMDMNASRQHSTPTALPSHEGFRWGEEQQGGKVGEGTPGSNVDRLFAEDWGGWLYQG